MLLHASSQPCLAWDRWLFRDLYGTGLKKWIPGTAAALWGWVEGKFLSALSSHVHFWDYFCLRNINAPAGINGICWRIHRLWQKLTAERRNLLFGSQERQGHREISLQNSQLYIFPAAFGLLSWFCFTCWIERQWQLSQWKIPRFVRSRRCTSGCWFVAGFILIK